MGTVLGAFRPAQAAVLSPTLNSVSPGQVYPGKTGQKLTLKGDFDSNDTVSFTPSAGITIVGAVNRVDTNTLEVTINVAADAANTARDVSVKGGLLGGTSTCSKCLVIGPDIPAASGVGGTLSNSASSGAFKVDGHAFKAGAVVKIERKGYGFGAAETVTATGSNVQVTPGTAQNGMVSSLTATVSTLNQPAGRWKVTVVNPDGNTAVFGDGITTGLEIAGGKPTLASISPAQINSNQELQFTLTGDNFAKGLTATVSEGGVTQTQAAHITSKTQAEITLRASASPGTTGARTLVLRNADGQSSSNAGALWVNQAPQPAGTPTVSTVSPSTLGVGADKVAVKVTGTNFGPTPAVTVSNPTGITIAVTRDSATQLTLAVSVAGNAATGARDLTVTNSQSETVTKSNALTIASDFQVTHAVPNGRPQGYSGTFQVLGSGFTGSPSVTISGSLATAGSVTVDSAARLTVGVNVAANAAPGARDISVTQGNVTKTCTGCFIVGEVPTVTSVSPTSGNGGGQVDVTVNGTKFADNPTVTLEKAGQNPINMILVNRQSASVITGTFDLTNAAPGVWDVKVVNVDGGTATKTGAFTVAVGNPTVTSSNPDFVTQNDTTEVLRITGTQFAPGMTVTIPDAGGVTVKDTKRISNTSADVTVATADNARLGSRDITVTNTDGKSGTCQACFVVTQGSQAKTYGPGVTAFENFTNGAFVAAGNLDGVPGNGAEFVAAVNSGGGPHVRPYRVNPANGNIQELGAGWYAYPAGFAGGVHVAIGDVDGNHANGDEIITAAGPSGGPHVKVWHLNNDLSVTELGGFFAYIPQFTGGVWVGAGDVDGDGTDEIITGAGPGGGPHVRVWKFANGGVTEVGGWFAYGGGFTGGVVVGAGNVVPEAGDVQPKDEVITVPASNGGPHVRITNGTGQVLRQFFAFATDDANGYRVASGDFDFDTVDDIAIGRGSDSEMLIAQVTESGFNRIVNPNPTPFGNLPTGTNVAAADVDGDGDDDLIIVPDHNNAVTIRLVRPTSLT
jgi:hypothetical protein